VLYNLYHCRLSDIPAVVCASEYDDDGDEEMMNYTEEELERMKLRPGIERALDVEHRKSLKKVVNMEMKRGGAAGSANKKKVMKKQLPTTTSSKTGNATNGKKRVEMVKMAGTTATKNKGTAQ